MEARATFNISFLSICVLTLGGCAGVAEHVVDNAAGFPATDLATDVKKTSDEYEQEKHEERVEELNQEYEEFMRSQGKPVTDDEESEQSIVIKKDDNDTD